METPPRYRKARPRVAPKFKALLNTPKPPMPEEIKESRFNTLTLEILLGYHRRILWLGLAAWPLLLGLLGKVNPSFPKLILIGVASLGGLLLTQMDEQWSRRQDISYWVIAVGSGIVTWLLLLLFFPGLVVIVALASTLRRPNTRERSRYSLARSLQNLGLMLCLGFSVLLIFNFYYCDGSELKCFTSFKEAVKIGMGFIWILLIFTELYLQALRLLKSDQKLIGFLKPYFYLLLVISILAGSLVTRVALWALDQGFKESQAELSFKWGVVWLSGSMLVVGLARSVNSKFWKLVKRRYGEFAN